MVPDQHTLLVGILFGVLSVPCAGANEFRQPSLGAPATVANREPVAAKSVGASEEEIRTCIVGLDAARFDAREQATRQLVTLGKSAIPYLVEALGEPSSELRFRARLLLSLHHSFEDVAPHLVNAVEMPYGSSVHAILRERATQHLDVACEAQNIDKLFKFWGTNTETYRVGALTRLFDAKSRVETSRAVQPLLGLDDKTARYGDALSRLETLSLSYDHRYSPGFVIAETLARGLRENHPKWIAFAEQHLAAFETLVHELRSQDTPTHAIRKEVSDRANMCRGAASYLVELLDEASPRRKLLQERLGIAPDGLPDEFCRGLGSTSPKQYDRSVGKVHIVDMLTEALGQWPDAPSDGIVQRLVAGATKTAADGDKPKALSFLDALDACRELSNHQLDIQTGLGKRLGERLYVAAAQSPNNRIYHPARSVHDKILALVDLGILPEHRAFPRQLFEDYLDGIAQATSDDQRLALERYLRILGRLHAAELSFKEPGIGRFTLAMRDCLSTRHDVLAMGITQLDLLLRAHQAEDGNTDARTVDNALGQWTNDVMSL